MHNGNVWELPFGEPAELELQTEWGSLELLPVEAGSTPRLELQRGSSEHIAVHVEKVGAVVRVALDPNRSFGWFGGWECRAVVYVPRNVRAAVETNAGSIAVRGLDGCELGIKANAGKIDLVDIYGLMHLAADAGSITGRGLGGFFNAETHAGSIRLEILDLQPGEHHIRATMGSVRLELARGMDVSIDTHTSMGSVRNHYPVRQDALARLILETEMGSIHVRETHAYQPRPRPARVGAETRSDTSVPAPPREDPELERVLKMVEAGDLSAQEADELLRAMGRV